MVEPEKGTTVGVISSKIFKGVHYEFIVNVGKNEVLCRDTHDHEVGAKVGIVVEKENIQIMHKELSVNQYTDAYINSNGQVVIGEDPFDADLTKLLPDSHLEDEGSTVLIGPDGKHYDLNDAEVVAEIDLDKIELSDDLSKGQAQGTIIQSVWIGDHYQYIVRTDDEEDYVVNSPFTWNENDIVSVAVEKEDIKLRLKTPIEELARE